MYLWAVERMRRDTDRGGVGHAAFYASTHTFLSFWSSSTPEPDYDNCSKAKMLIIKLELDATTNKCYFDIPSIKVWLDILKTKKWNTHSYKNHDYMQQLQKTKREIDNNVSISSTKCYFLFWSCFHLLLSWGNCNILTDITWFHWWLSWK